MEILQMPKSSENHSPVFLLCVNNDTQLLDILKTYFENKPGFSVLTCPTSAEARALISQYQFDAIISDYTLPDMDGIELLKEIRSQNDSALFIIFTGRHLARVAIETLNNGGNYYIQKGGDILFDLQKMEEFIRTSVYNRRMSHVVPDSNTRYRSIIEQQQDLLCCFLPDGSCTFANAAYADFIGRAEIEITRTNFLAIIPQNERDRIQKLLSGLTPEYPGTYIEHHVLSTTGEPLLFQWSYRAFFNEEGSIGEYLAQGRNLSSVIKLDEILPHGSYETRPGITRQVVPPPGSIRTSLEDLADSADRVPYPIFAVDKQGVVVAWNQAIADLTGINAWAIMGKGNHAYSFTIYGKARHMLVDSIIQGASVQDIELPPGIIRDGDTYLGEEEHVTIRKKPMRIRMKATPVYDSNGTILAAVQSLLVSEEPQEQNLFDDIREQYIGGISSIILKVTGEGLVGNITGALGSATGGYGVYVTDKRLMVVRNPNRDGSLPEGMTLGKFIIDELFGINVDLRPRSIADLEKIRVFEVWRNNITAIEMKTPRLLAGFVIIRTANGGSYRIFVDHSKAFVHLEQLLNMFYHGSIQKDKEVDDADLEWLNEIHELELVDKLQIEDPFRDIPHEVITNLPRTPVCPSISVSQGQYREIAESIENVPYPIFAVDLQGIVIAWNRAIARLTGIEPWDMIGKGGYEYAYPFYGERRPMLLDYLIMPPDTQLSSELPAITREGDTFIGSLERVSIHGTLTLTWGKARRIYDTRGEPIAAIQSILYSEQEEITASSGKQDEEQYLGGLSSITVKVPGDGVIGALAGALGSTTGGYGIYSTNHRVFVIHNPKLDASQSKEMQFGEFIINELFGITVDTNPRTIAELERMKVFEVTREDIVTIGLKKPLLFAGHITFRVRSGEVFRVYTDHKKAYIHLEQLLRLYYSDLLRIE